MRCFLVLKKLLSWNNSTNSRKDIIELIANEKCHYVPPRHDRPILKNLLEIGEAVKNHFVIEIKYERLKEPKLVHRTLEPVGIMFSEYYFYLIAFIQNMQHNIDSQNREDLFPTIYRIDRIISLKTLPKNFHKNNNYRFEEGIVRKQVQFMYSGKLRRIKFRYMGASLEAVYDRLPTAKLIGKDEQGYIIQADVSGEGIDMWIKSQGENVEVLK